MEAVDGIELYALSGAQRETNVVSEIHLHGRIAELEARVLELQQLLEGQEIAIDPALTLHESEVSSEASAVTLHPAHSRWSLALATDYFHRWRGVRPLSPPSNLTLAALIVSVIGSFLAISLLGIFHMYVFPNVTSVVLHGWLGSMGASAVLIFAMPYSDASQPRAVMGGHIIAAAIGIALSLASLPKWLAGGLGVSLTILAMQLTKTIHPPAGATALIASALSCDPSGANPAGFYYILVSNPQTLTISSDGSLFF